MNAYSLDNPFTAAYLQENLREESPRLVLNQENEANLKERPQKVEADLANREKELADNYLGRAVVLQATQELADRIGQAKD